MAVRPPRRLNVTALLLSAALLVLMLLPLLGMGAGLLPSLGFMEQGGASSAGTPHRVPPPRRTCRSQDRVPWGGYRFTAECAGQAPSFDGRYFVVKNAGLGTGVGLVRGGSGESLDDLGMLDGDPITVFWAPSGYRFFANRQPKTGLDRFHLFDAQGGDAVERRDLAAAARAVLVARRPCMTPEDIAVSGVRWGRDARRIALLVYSRRTACGGTGAWRPLWMIGDAVTGRIDPASVRARSGRDPLPADGPYATL